MRALRIALLGLALIATAALAEAFAPGLNDLPLMTGLTGRADESTVFDAPGGRIVESWAVGPVSRPAVQEFYRATLPQLGWTETGTNRFQRESEVLTVEFPAAGPQGERPPAGQLLVRFYVSPK